jgi:hypothetical protein
LGPANVRKTLRKEQSSDVVLNHYVKPTSKATVAKVVSLERNQTKYVYAIRKSDDDANGEYKPFNALVSACGLAFCLINQSNEKLVKGNPNFISFDDFLKDCQSLIAKPKLKALVNTLKGVILERGHHWEDRHIIPVYSGLAKQKLKDKALAYAVKTLSNYQPDQTLKASDGTTLGGYRSDFKGNAKVKALIKAIPETREYSQQEIKMQSFKKQYVLLQSVQYTAHNKISTIAPLALYLNSAYQKAA